MKLIDTHTHLYLEDFTSDIDQIILRAFNEGVDKFYLPSICSKEIDAMLQLENKYPGKCFAMMGLHPTSVKENYKNELMIVNDWLQKRKFAAIGETGLDFFWDKTFTHQQYESFNQQLEWSLQYNLPVVIHTREAMQETIDVVKKFSSKKLRGIFHCFNGNYKNAGDVINAGFLLGIGGLITYKNAGVAETIKEIDLAYIVVETDAPYLSPVPFRGKRNESSYLKYIIKKLAEIKNIEEEEVAAITTANAEKLFTDTVT
ncbi:MAG: TatD family hydrolase [Ginsengibacter sp.]